MADEVTEELKEQILAFFAKRARTKSMLTVVDIKKGVKISKSLAKKAVTVMTKEGSLEFVSYGGATFIKVPETETSE